MSNQAGFTLTEVLVAMALLAVIAGAAFLMLDVGLASFDAGHESYDDAMNATRAFDAVRAEVARSASIVSVASDSLVVEKSDGSRVSFVVRDAAAGKNLFRLEDAGGGVWVERPGYALATMRDAAGAAAIASFSSIDADRVRFSLRSAGIEADFAASSWIDDDAVPPGGGGGGGGGDDNITICHRPGTKQETTMSIPPSAWNGHQNHGDTLGACGS